MEKEKNQVNVAIGFVTGRKNFRNLLKTYVSNWNEHDLIENGRISLNLIIAYDLKYTKTRVSDYKRIEPEIYEWMDSVDFIGQSSVANEIKYLISHGVIDSREAKLVFGDGYGKKRNVVIYWALKNGMDYLLFIDDDEYPLAVLQGENNRIYWVGQSVVRTHLRYIKDAGITHGYHCGYISPIPYLEFNNILTEEDFRVFIESISNDIISWESIRSKMRDGGITFADSSILDRNYGEEVKEINGCKFISGSNLCLNLKKAEKIAPFYNPPGARGEDTFLSTCLADVKVVKVPTYTFHDGFLNYTHLLHGALPKTLKPISADSHQIVARFIKAALGWVRYKPLLLYITQKDRYQEEIDKMQANLVQVVPKLCLYFNTNEFTRIHDDLEYYHRNVVKHYETFSQTRQVWKKIVTFLTSQQPVNRAHKEIV
jgi:hypothetical protein